MTMFKIKIKSINEPVIISKIMLFEKLAHKIVVNVI